MNAAVRSAVAAIGAVSVVGATVLTTAASAATPTAPTTPTTPATTAVPTAHPSTLDYGLQARAVAPGHWVIEGAVDDFGRHNGCNIINTAVVDTGAGVVVINTGVSRRYGEQQRQAIARVLPQAGTAGVSVLNLNLHPDYFLGNQAWADVPTRALAGSRAGMQAEGAAYADNLYRLCGDWMAGTEPAPARETVALNDPAQPEPLGRATHPLLLRRLQGHTGDDLVVLDPVARVAYVGGLVFMNRVPTTPHADFAQWLQSLDTLERWLTEGDYQTVVPSHGPVHSGLQGLAQTRDWLQWLQATMQDSAQRGLDLNEVLHDVPVPARFAHWAAMPAELHRTLTQWYPLYERRALAR